MVKWNKIEDALSDPKLREANEELQKFYEETENPAEIQEALVEGDFERAIEVSSYSEEEFYSRWEEIYEKATKVAERYGLTFE